ncbi:50S ribosomal protein L18 [Patescibacteria group bacterium]|nr:50S ribosomal protein L18 [Patescibacteria group bacterium]
MKRKLKKEARYRGHKRVRAKISGSANRPRLCVFRSNKHMYAQLIDDEKGITLAVASNLEFKKPTVRPQQKIKTKNKKVEKKLSGKIGTAYEVGKLIAKKALKKKIKKVVFDRGGYKYHGRVKALAEGAREEGLRF